VDAFAAQRIGPLRWIGTLLALVFLFLLVFGLAPWHWRWMHAVPRGRRDVGRLMAGLLVSYLNIQGAWVVAAVLAAVGSILPRRSASRL
jgi:hypothetical protein